ncbi:MAG: hypothetical protein ACP5GJ_03670 [Nanopusillaceae archaeon]|jgi:hypothetical protein
MPLIIPSSEYSKRRKILELDKKIKEAREKSKGKVNVILKKEVDLSNSNDAVKLISMLYRLEEEGYFDELYIIKQNQLLDFIDILNEENIKDIPKEKILKLYNIIDKMINIIEKLKNIH